MSDIVQRLRKEHGAYAAIWPEHATTVWSDAADEIENLRTIISEGLRYQRKLEAEIELLRAENVKQLAHALGVLTELTEATQEIERLRAALTEIRDLHQPTEPVLACRSTCVWCGAADGSWPCTTRLVADEALVKAEQENDR